MNAGAHEEFELQAREFVRANTPQKTKESEAQEAKITSHSVNNFTKQGFHQGTPHFHLCATPKRPMHQVVNKTYPSVSPTLAIVHRLQTLAVIMGWKGPVIMVRYTF